MYQLLAGGVRMCNYSFSGKEAVIGIFNPGDCFGELGIIDGLPRLGHAIAAGPTTLRVLSKKQFFLLYDKYSEFSKQLKELKREGIIEVCYGKIYIKDMEALNQQYENLMGQEQLTAVYHKK